MANEIERQWSQLMVRIAEPDESLVNELESIQVDLQAELFGGRPDPDRGYEPSLLFETSDNGKPNSVSGLVRHFNIRSVTAHVHEANEDGLKWYVARGFKVQDDVVEGYYRRLKPSGARIVRLDVEWENKKEVDGEQQIQQQPPAEAEAISQEGTDIRDDIPDLRRLARHPKPRRGQRDPSITCRGGGGRAGRGR